MKRLTELGIKYNTDKATGHGYTDFYHDYLVKYINPNLLEIGIYDGASLKMWEEFFGSPLIVGVDILEKKQYETNNIKTVVADQGKREELFKCLDICKEYDIIIDDGSHIIGHQISTLANIFPYLTSGGTYILEDLHTSFIHGEYNPDGDPFTAYDFVYRLGKNLDVQSRYASQDQINYLRDNISELKIFQLNEHDYMHSITSVIVKK